MDGRLITAKEVAEDLECSMQHAYKIERQLNADTKWAASRCGGGRTQLHEKGRFRSDSDSRFRFTTVLPRRVGAGHGADLCRGEAPARRRAPGASPERKLPSIRGLVEPPGGANDLGGKPSSLTASGHPITANVRRKSRPGSLAGRMPVTKTYGYPQVRRLAASNSLGQPRKAFSLRLAHGGRRTRTIPTRKLGARPRCAW